MGMPTDIGVIDLMLGIPDPGKKEGWYDFLKPNLRDAESATFKFPAQYMFKDVPKDPTDGDPPLVVPTARLALAGPADA